MRTIEIDLNFLSVIQLTVGETVLIRVLSIPEGRFISRCEVTPVELATCDRVADDQIEVTGLQEGVGTLEIAVVFMPDEMVFYPYPLVVETMEE